MDDFGLSLSSNVGTRMLDYCLFCLKHTNKIGYATLDAISGVPDSVKDGVKNFAKDKILDFATSKIQQSLGIDSDKIPNDALELAEDFAEFLSDEAKKEVKKLNY